MAAPKSRSHTKTRAAKVASSATGVRGRIRELSAQALRKGESSLAGIRSVVQDVLEGATDAVDKSIPVNRGNVLREVFDGLREGVQAAASAGARAGRETRERGARSGKNAAAMTARVQAAGTEFLSAVESFASKTSGEVRDELDSLVASARRTGWKVADSAQNAAAAADGRMLELSSETARAGVRVVRRVAGALATSASGLLQGLAGAIAPPPKAARRRTGRSRQRPRASKRAPGGKKKTGKKAHRTKRGTRKKA